MLHRRWIGIERNEKYIAIAQQRLDAITPDKFREDVYAFSNKRQQPRIPFGMLLEHGLLKLKRGVWTQMKTGLFRAGITPASIWHLVERVGLQNYGRMIGNPLFLTAWDNVIQFAVLSILMG